MTPRKGTSVQRPLTLKPILRIVAIIIVVYFMIDLCRYIAARHLSKVSSLIHYNLWRFSFLPCGFLKKPFIQITGTRSAMIMWETNCRFDDTEVFYHRTPAYRSGPKQQLHTDEGNEHRIGVGSMEIVLHANNRFIYRIYLDPLISDSYYHYLVRLVPEERLELLRKFGRTTGDLTPHFSKFYFPGELAENVSLTVIGDNHGDANTFNQLLKLMNHRRPELLIHVGDMVQNAHKKYDWQVSFFDPIQRTHFGSQVPVLIGMGNHDMTQYGPVDYFAPLRSLSRGEQHAKNHAYHYAVSIGPARFIVLDCTNQDDAQIQWLDIELSSVVAQKSTFRIVIVHFPPFIEYWDPESWRGGENQWPKQVRQKMVPLFEKYHVDLVLSGHQHNYQRGFKSGVHYITTGGGGGPVDRNRVEDHKIYKVTKFENHYLHMNISRASIDIRAFNVANREFDSLTVPKNVIRRFRMNDP